MNTDSSRISVWITPLKSARTHPSQRPRPERDIAIAQAAADNDANDARVAAETQIAQKNNELASKKAELQKASDTKKAEADAAYELQKQEQEALAKKAQADAEQYEREKVAEAQKAIAEAQKYSMVQEAEGIRAKGEAEAAAIRAKALAEAEGMEKKAEAYQKYNKAAMAEMMIQVLPEIAGKIAEPLSRIDKITIIGGGNDSDNGVGSIAGNVPVVMARLFESMKETTGVDLAEIIKSDTYDAKVSRNVNLTGAPDIILGSGQNSVKSNPDSDNILS